MLCIDINKFAMSAPHSIFMFVLQKKNQKSEHSFLPSFPVVQCSLYSNK